MATSSLRNRIFALGAPKTQRVTISVDGETLDVDVRALGIAARGELMTRCMVPNDDGEGHHVDLGRISPDLVIACAMDPATGEPLFSPADREAVGAMSADVLDPIISAAAHLSGLSEAANASAEKNSAPTTGSDSSSPLLAN